MTATHQVPTRLRLIHGFGSIAYGVKDNGFSVFLLLYYNQVLGMDARLVSLALLIALLVDAAIDPMLGHLSDRTYTRWGKRLPWLYVAPIPLAIAWTLLWMPPGGVASFWELLGLAIAVRVLLSACEVPSVALVPELTTDYDERTAIMRIRFLFGWTGGLLMTLLAYNVFLGDGMLEVEGYAAFGATGAVLMAGTVLLSALGQHRRVARIPAQRPGPFSLRGAFTEITESLSHRAFLVLVGAAAAAFASQGLTFASFNYLFLYVWNFSETAFKVYPLVLFGSVILAFLTVAPLHRAIGKRRGAVLAAAISTVLWLLPYVLLALDAWPGGTGNSSFALLFGLMLAGNTFAIVVMISLSSMVADVVEASQERTGRREEATFFAGYFFMQKCATGLGIFLTGQIVAFAGLPDQSAPGGVAAEVSSRLAYTYAGAVFVLAMVSIAFLRRFPIEREDHMARLAALDAAARVEPDASGLHP